MHKSYSPMLNLVSMISMWKYNNHILVNDSLVEIPYEFLVTHKKVSIHLQKERLESVCLQTADVFSMMSLMSHENGGYL